MDRQRRLGVTAFLLLAGGCSLNATAPGGLAHRAGAEIPPSELRIRVRSQVNPCLAAIEQAADRAALQCGSEPGVRIRALEWKLGAIPAAQDALMQPDPGAALLDGWAYAIQMQDYFDRGAGRRQLGSCHGIAVDAARGLERDLRGTVELFVPDEVEADERALRQWASSHPLEGLMLPRTTTADLLASRTARRALGALATVGAAVETLDDLTARIAFYRESLLKEGQWMAKLTANEAISSDAAARVQLEMERVARAADRLGALSAELPRVVERERSAAMAEIDRQRVDTLRALQGAGDAALGRAQGIGQAAIDQAADRADRLVDRAFLRGAQLAIGTGLVLLIAVVGVVWLLGVRIRLPRRA